MDAGYTHPDPMEVNAENFGYADGDEVSTAKLALLTDNGTLCSECGAQFVASHGEKVACTFCWARLPVEDAVKIKRATHPEKNKQAHANEARKRKARKNV